MKTGLALVKEMFPPLTSAEDGAQGSAQWSGSLFRRAYYEGKFDQVERRLSHHFSSLVYLPGNCMRAAAEVVKKIEGVTWKEYLDELEGDDALDGIWKKVSADIFGRRKKDRVPGSIFHNLDLLSDSRGSVYPHPYAQTALFGLVEGARNGVVLGMSDRDEPELPASLARVFTDRVRIDEIPYENFHRIIPYELGEKLYDWEKEKLGEGTIWLLASRLHWTDPIRAYRIMLSAQRNARDLAAVLAEIVQSTRTVDYMLPKEAFFGDELTGFRAGDVERLERDIILPFTQWRKLKGSRRDYERAVAKLPPGAILYGPPGTGKTHLARWIAKRIDLPVRIVSGGDLRSSDWGQAERNVRALFRDARRAAPCVLVLDDADDLLPDRDKASGSVASAERAVVNEFLQQMQGFRGHLEGVLIILTTNRFDSLDAAARARLPIHVHVPYPDQDETILGQIVRAVGDEFGYDLTETVQPLIHLFKGPISSSADPKDDTKPNYFSPREIRQAMRMLESWDDLARSDRPYRTTLKDVERVRHIYKPSEYVRAGEIPARPA